MQINGINQELDLTETEVQNYKEVFETVCLSLSKVSDEKMVSMKEVSYCMENVINSNVADINLNGMGRIKVAEVYKLKNESSESLDSAYVLDCCLDFFHGANLISDNIMDGRKTLLATGNPTWHTSPKVDMRALNDSIQLRKMTFQILKLFFSSNISLYNKLEDIRADVLEKHVLGRGLSEKMMKSRNIGENITIAGYRQLVNFIFGYSRFYAPVIFALTLAGKLVDLKMDRNLKDVLLDIGYLKKFEMDHATVSEIYNKKNNLIDRDLKHNWLFVKTVEIMKQDRADMSNLFDCVKQRNTAGLNSIYENNEVFKHLEEEKTKLICNILDKIDSSKLIDDEMKHFLRSLISHTI